MNQMHQSILILKSILFLFNFCSIMINCFIPLYYVFAHNYKIHSLKDKNIPANINHHKQKVYIHFKSSFNSLLILIVLIYDFFH